MTCHSCETQSKNKWCKGKVNWLFAGRVFLLLVTQNITHSNDHRKLGTQMTKYKSHLYLPTKAVNANATNNERKALECKCAYSYFSVTVIHERKHWGQ